MQYLGQYASVPIIQREKGQETVVQEVEQAMMMLLEAYKQRNGYLPQQYVVRYSDRPRRTAAADQQRGGNAACFTARPATLCDGF